jgi:hypothetical protein
LPSIASILRWPEPTTPSFLLDPVAGDGAAIQTLRRLWIDSAPDGAEFDHYYTRMSLYACELEAERARALEEGLGFGDVAFHGDAFRLCPPSPMAARATVLYLNPPYDTDPVYRRLEHRFLDRFTLHLHPGSGFLFYLVPHYALEPSADFLARHFLEIRAWRLPEPEFSAYKQVLLVGRRARRPLASPSFAPMILRWAEDASSLPELPARCPEPFVVEPDAEMPFCLDYELASHDLTASIVAFRPWEGLPVGTSLSARGLLGSRFETAMPPRPVHIALALSSGMFNGHRLEPDDPRHPPLLAKGVFERELVPVSERYNDDGDFLGSIEVERPRLSLTVLRLDDYSFHELRAGTVPAGGDDVSLWNAADLIGNYARSLARLLAQQFPALHHPGLKEDRIALPKLARKPFRAQAEAAMASLKLLARGDDPFLVAEVGTGKSTIALTVCGALLPEHHATTMGELRRMGLPDKIPQVERILILCPPHLLKSWTDQAAAVLPDLTVQIVERPIDLRRAAQIFILSREAAKLGHGHQGVADRCPRCGSLLETSAATNATRRLRCTAVPRRPKNRSARLAIYLASLLAPSCPDYALIGDLVAAEPLRRRLVLPGRPLAASRLVDFHDHLLREIEDLYGMGDEQEEQATLLPISKQLLRFDLALHTRSRALPVLEDLLRRGEPTSYGPHSWIRPVVQAFKSRRAEDPTDAERTRALLAVLEVLHSLALWEEGPRCAEPLYQAVPKPRRYPLAKIIQRHHAEDFDFLIFDEGQEYNNAGSAQANAAHRLAGLPGVRKMLLSGSLMGGYASSLFANFWALSRRFRAEFGRDDRSLFVDRYGFRKMLVSEEEDSAEGRRFGSHSDRRLGARTTVLSEAPGLMPAFILKHLLPIAVFLHKKDLDVELPLLTEIPVPISFPIDDPLAQELFEEYDEMQEQLLRCIRADRFSKERSGRLLGALVELPSYLDWATDDLPPFEVRYPEELGGGLVAAGRAFPASWRTPKETWLLARVAELLAHGEKVIVFLRHTGSAELPNRLLRLLREVTPSVAWLDTKKVPTASREAWIDEHVLKPRIKVLLVNPNAVKTGLNNLVSFSAGLWYELDLSAYTIRQAGGRFHRIGQTRPVSLEIPFYAGTTQEVMFDLVADKIGVSLQVDALDLRSALAALGISDEETDGLSAALSLGQAVYDTLTNRRR